jgi:hypothetical protein
MVTAKTLALLIVVALVAGACGSSTSKSQATSDAGKHAVASMKIGSKGGVVGSLKTDGISLDVPPGALAKDVTIGVEMVGDAPSGHDALSALYRFTPEGTAFAKPVTITLAMSKAEAHAVVYFTKLKSDEFENIGGKVSGKNISTDVMHFSQGFAGMPDASAQSDAGVSGAADAASSAADASNGASDAGSVAMAPGCPPAGTYTLTSFKCGTMDITSTWMSIVPTSTLTFSSDGNDCKMVISNESAACKETQEDHLVFGATASHTSLGITSCSPDQCKFSSDDAPCMKGDRAKPTSDGAPDPFELVDGQLTIHTPANSGDLCGTVEGIQVFDLHPSAAHDAGPAASKWKDNGDGTVNDSGATLTWQQQVPSATYLWDDAVTYCGGLALAGGGFRLPTLDELKTLVDLQFSPARIDPTFFPDTPAAQFWTSSPNGSSQHWYVDFQNGQPNARSGNMLNVRCVR